MVSTPAINRELLVSLFHRSTRLGPLIPPLLLLVVLLLMPRAIPGFSSWVDNAGLQFLPWLMLAVAFTLGLSFGQTRISLCSVLIAVAAASVERFMFREPALEAQAPAILLALLAVLPGIVLLYLFGEKGLLTEHGALRIGLVVLGCMVTAWLPNHPDMLRVLWGHNAPLLRTLSDGLGGARGTDGC